MIEVNSLMNFLGAWIIIIGYVMVIQLAFHITLFIEFIKNHDRLVVGLTTFYFIGVPILFIAIQNTINTSL